MVSCSVFSCRRRSQTSNLRNHGISYHMFPKHYTLREKWRVSCGQKKSWAPTHNSVICSDHFTSSSFQALSNNRRILVADAVPTLRLCQHWHNGRDCRDFQGPCQSSLSIVPSVNEQTESNQSDNVDYDGGYDEHSPHSGDNEITANSLNDITVDHPNVYCNECHKQITGYVCVECVDWDMCGACEARAAHSQHYVLRLPTPQADVKSLITVIREQLKIFFNKAQTMEYYIEDIKLEYDLDIKEEPLEIENDSTVPRQSQTYEILITPDVVTQNSITEKKYNPDQDLSYMQADDKEIHKTTRKKAILAQSVPSIVLYKQVIQTTIKEEPFETTLVPETTPSTRYISSVTENVPLTQQPSAIALYSSTESPKKKIRYK